MTNQVRLYIKKKITRQWSLKRESNNGEFIAFSPYLTSPTADSVLAPTGNHQHCRVYTLFNAEVFANGSSSIRTLKRLKTQGVKLFAIENLHAKVVVVPEVCASIGSQNITGKGNHNLEASVLFSDRATVNNIWSELQPWIQNATEISSEMIEDMIRLLPPIKKAVKKVVEKSRQLDEKIKNEEHERQKQQEADLLKKSQEIRRDQIQQFRSETTLQWNRLEKSRQEIPVKVSSRIGSNGYKSEVLSRTSASDDLTLWQIRDVLPFKLNRLSNYLCLIYGSWKIGFCRVGKTGIRFVGNSIKRNEKTFQIAGETCQVAFSANWVSDDSPNLVCTIHPAGFRGKLNLTGWFRLTGFSIVEMECINDVNRPDLEDWANSNKAAIERDILSPLLSTFYYANPTSISRANAFFGPRKTSYLLRLGMIEKHPMLVAIRQ